MRRVNPMWNVTSLTPLLRWPYRLLHCVDVKTRPLLNVIRNEKVAIVLSLTSLKMQQEKLVENTRQWHTDDIETLLLYSLALYFTLFNKILSIIVIMCYAWTSIHLTIGSIVLGISPLGTLLLDSTRIPFPPSWCKSVMTWKKTMICLMNPQRIHGKWKLEDRKFTDFIPNILPTRFNF